MIRKLTLALAATLTLGACSNTMGPEYYDTTELYDPSPDASIEQPASTGQVTGEDQSGRGTVAEDLTE